MQNTKVLQDKLFIVGNTRSKYKIDLPDILYKLQLTYATNSNIDERYTDEVLISLDKEKTLEVSIMLAQKIIRDMKLGDTGDEGGVEFSIDKYPLIQLSQVSLSTYYTELYSRFVNNVLKMKMQDFMNREKFDAIITEAIKPLERIFIWHVDFDEPMSLDMYLKYFTEEMDTDEEDLFNLYIYEAYHINPDAITILPLYNRNIREE